MCTFYHLSSVIWNILNRITTHACERPLILVIIVVVFIFVVNVVVVVIFLPMKISTFIAIYYYMLFFPHGVLLLGVINAINVILNWNKNQKIIRLSFSLSIYSFTFSVYHLVCRLHSFTIFLFVASSHFYWTASHAIGSYSAVSSRTNTPNPHTLQQQQVQHQLSQQLSQRDEFAGTKFSWVCCSVFFFLCYLKYCMDFRFNDSNHEKQKMGRKIVWLNEMLFICS